MHIKTGKIVAALCLCGVILGLNPGESEAAAAYTGHEVGVETSSSYLVKIDAPSAKLYTSANEGTAVVGKLTRGNTYDVVAYHDGWARVDSGEAVGYLKVVGQATIVETTREKVDKEAELRVDVIQYALQFVGNRYVYGGTDPNTGADCSGFTSYVMRHAAGVYLSHSSAAQAGEGKVVAAMEPKPGDLIFYSNGSRINHVAIYIGNHQIVHASTEKTGIKISQWNHRTPVRVVDVLSR